MGCVPSDLHFTSFQSLDRLGHRGDMGHDSAEILFRSFLQEAIVSDSGMGKDVHSLMLSFQHFFCRSRRHPPSKVPRTMVLKTLSWRVTCANRASFRLLTIARRSSCGRTRKMTLLRTYYYHRTYIFSANLRAARSHLAHWVRADEV